MADVPYKTGNPYIDADFEAVSGGGGGGLVLLESQTASASPSLDFASWYSSDYDVYVIEIINLIPTNTDEDFWLQVSTDGGVTYDNTIGHYDWATWRWTGAGDGLSGQNGDRVVVLTGGFGVVGNTVAWGGVVGTIKLFNPGSASVYKRMTMDLQYGATSLSGTVVRFDTGATYLQTAAVNAFHIITAGTGDTIASGTVRIYGLAK